MTPNQERVSAQFSSSEKPVQPLVFRSKSNVYLYIFPIIIFIIFLGGVYFLLSSEPFFSTLAVAFGALVVLAAYSFFYLSIKNITYTIDGENLTITNTSVFNKKSTVVGIDRIQSIIKGNYIDSNTFDYSLSFDKLRINYDNGRCVYVSPEDEAGFVKLLQSINPRIGYGA